MEQIITIMTKCLIVKIIIYTSLVECKDLILKSEIYEENIVVTQVMKQFKAYNIIFHFDNFTKSDVGFIMKNIRTAESYFTVNYDMKPNNSTVLLRPTGYMFLHIILLQDYKRFDR